MRELGQITVFYTVGVFRALSNICQTFEARVYG